RCCNSTSMCLKSRRATRRKNRIDLRQRLLASDMVFLCYQNRARRIRSLAKCERKASGLHIKVYHNENAERSVRRMPFYIQSSDTSILLYFLLFQTRIDESFKNI